MKKVYILLALVILLGATAVGAAGLYPDRVEVFEIPSGHTCVLVEDYFECYCPCADECVVVVTEIEKKVIIEEKEKGKEKCNAGRGNGSELYWDGNKWVDCDPGNSGKNNGGD